MPARLGRVENCKQTPPRGRLPLLPRFYPLWTLNPTPGHSVFNWFGFRVLPWGSDEGRASGLLSIHGHVSAQSVREQGQGKEATVPPAPSSWEDGAGLWPERSPVQRTSDAPRRCFIPALGPDLGQHRIAAGVCPTRADTFQRETALLSDTQERKGLNRNNPWTVKRHLAFETKF